MLVRFPFRFEVMGMAQWFRRGASVLMLCVTAAACGAGQDIAGVRTSNDNDSSRSAVSENADSVDAGLVDGDGLLDSSVLSDADPDSGSVAAVGGDMPDVSGGNGADSDFGTMPDFEQAAARVAEFVSDPTEEAHLAVTEALTGADGQAGVGAVTVDIGGLMHVQADFEIDRDGDQMMSLTQTIGEAGSSDEFTFSFDLMLVSGEVFARFHEIDVGNADALMAELLIGGYADRWVTVGSDEFDILGLGDLGVLCDDPAAAFCSPGGVDQLAPVVVTAEFGDDSIGDLDWTHVRFLAAVEAAGEDLGDSATVADPFSDLAVPLHAWIDSDGRLRRLNLDSDTIAKVLGYGFDDGTGLDEFESAGMFALQLSVTWASYEPASDITAPADIAGSLSDLPLFAAGLADNGTTP